MKIFSHPIGYASFSMAIAILGGCNSPLSPLDNVKTSTQGATQLRSTSKTLEMAPASIIRGIYVSETNRMTAVGTVFAYHQDNQKNRPPICSVPVQLNGVNGIAVDRGGNLIIPQGNRNSAIYTVVVTKGPGLCGSKMGSFNDPYGIPEDADSNNAATGKIALATGNDNGTCSGPCPGSVTVCTLAAGCNTNLTDPNMYSVYGVAMDPKGNCWVDAEDRNGLATLTTFAHCAGSGLEATGFTDFSGGDGGIQIDTSGNIVAIARAAGQQSAVYVYRGCKPACQLVGGPFATIPHTFPIWGHLNKAGNTLALGYAKEVDIYAYTPTSLTYKYRFTNGLDGSYFDGVNDAAFIPR